MSLRHHEIAEADHRILDPFSETKLRLLGELAGVAPGTRVLDLACGKGELLCQWAGWFGSGGLGVDLSHVFLAAARERAIELGVSDRVRFEHGDAGSHPVQAGTFDIACCLGATWIGGGLAGTLALLRPAIRTSGLVLVGEPWYIDEPPAEAFDAWCFAADAHATLDGTLQRIADAGSEVLDMVNASMDDWDRYEASQWRTISDWLRANPTDPDHEAIVTFLASSRASYARFTRRYLGWGVFLTRPV